MTSTVKIIATRAFYFQGNVIPVGTVLELSPLEAANCLGGTRANLVNPDDRELTLQASRRADATSAPMPHDKSKSFVHSY